MKPNTLVFTLLRSALLRTCLYDVKTAAEQKEELLLFEQTLQNTQLQLEGLTPGCGVKSIFVINLSILISGSQRTRWCLCVYCATVGFPYFGGPLGQCLEPMYAQLLSE